MPSQIALGSQTREGSLEALAELLAGLIGTAGKLRAYKSTFAPGPNSTEADFEANECDYTGYAAVALTWSVIGLDASGNAIALSNRAFFQATDGVVPNTVGGVWLDVTTVVGPPATDVALDYWEFDSPVPLTNALAAFGVVIGMSQPSQPGYAQVDY